MDPRLPRAFAAMAAMVPEGADDATASRFTAHAMVVAAQLLKAPDGLHSIQSGHWLSPATSERDRLMCALPIGIALSTIDPGSHAAARPGTSSSRRHSSRRLYHSLSTPMLLPLVRQ